MKKTAISMCIISIAVFCNTALGDIDSDLVAYYDFESVAEIKGAPIVDRSGNSHFGFCRQDQSTTKTPTIVDGPSGLGDALYFDGNFYVQISNHEDFDITESITISLWFKVSQFDTEWQTMFCRGDWSWRMARNGLTDAACFHLSGFGDIYGSSGAININDGQWHHIVGVWDGSGNATKMWIDGIQDIADDAVLTGSINAGGSDPVTIGAQIDEGILSRQWKGSIDEVRLYNRALSDSDVMELCSFSYLEPLPTVTLSSSKYLNTYSGSAEIKLEGIICDDGFPLPGNPSNPDTNDPNKLSWWWEVTEKPLEASEVIFESDDPADIEGSAFVYDDPNQIITVDPNVTITKPGYYEFRLYASDGETTHYSTTSVHLHPYSAYDYRSKGYLYLSPVPGAEYESAGTNFFLIRFVQISPYDIQNLSSFITVRGGKSGLHSGTAKIASDKETVIFTVNSTFSSNELVTVTLNPMHNSSKGTVSSYEYQFMTSGAMATSSMFDSQEDNSISLNTSTQGYLPLAASFPTVMANGVSVPSNFPHINISVNDNPDEGYIFLDNRTSGSNSYNVIFDNYGSPIWYWQTSDERRDMKVQPNGMLTMLQRSPMSFIGLDKNYRQVKTFSAVNGTSTDEHELFVREDGYYFLIGRRTENVDMRKYVSGGSSSASVDQTQIQGFTPEGDLIFQWRAWDHIDIADMELDSPYSSSMRYPHFNAIFFDHDGQLLVSMRHISQVCKIDLHSGEIIWKLGGNKSYFTFVNDSLNGFRNQHSISATTPGRYLLFDNGDLHSPSVSRGVEYELDTNDMTATVVWQYPETPTTSIYSHYMGNTQRLPNGNTLINWAVGNLPKLTEVRPDGTKAFEMNWVNGYEAYRTWRCKWDGMALEPVLQPIEYQSLDTLILIFNKFGDPNVSYYKIYAGKEPNPNELWTVSNSTLAYVSGFPESGTYYFRVSAVDANGTESGLSNEKSATVSISGSNSDLVQNGDFSEGIKNWIWETTSASASLEIKDGVFHYVISNGGTDYPNVQLRQKGIPLVQGMEYVFEFDAWAAQGWRYIEAKVGQEVSPWRNYSGIGPTYITTEPQHFKYTFTMNDATDMNSRVVINAGDSDIDVYLDNVSLKTVSAQ
ncbi:MAG: aryl-sulfate sulfotransferase [Sedimentisphaerales bacterium]|nr:aryl-sulfate sulfotransferase [Sedimentisphaerales bacterium]